MTSGSVFKLKRGIGMREGSRRGRGVRLRGGSRMQRRGDDYDDSDEDEDDDEEEEEEEEEDSEDGGRDRRHRQRRRRRRTDDDDEDEDDEDEDSEGQEFDPDEEEMDTLEDEEDEEDMEEDDGRWDSDPEPPVLLVSDLNDDLLSGSYLTVTLQRPHKAKRQSGKCGNIRHEMVSRMRRLTCCHCSGSIVPKLEAAMGPRSAAGGAGAQQGFIQRKTALSKPGRLTADGVSPRGPGR